MIQAILKGKLTNPQSHPHPHPHPHTHTQEMLKFSSINKTSLTSAGQSALFLAVNSNKIDTVRWLLERKDVEGRELTGLPVYDINETTLDGRTPLWQAAYKNYKEIAEFLIERGCNVLKTSNPGIVDKVLNRRVMIGDVVLLMPHKDRCKVVSVEGSEDIHSVKVGDEVQAKYKKSDKFYAARVVKIHAVVPPVYDLEYYDGATAEEVGRNAFHKEEKKVLEEGKEESEEKKLLVPGVDFDDGSQEYQRMIKEESRTRKAVVRLISETTHSWRHPSKEVETTCDKLKVMDWLGSLPSEAARCVGNEEILVLLRKAEEKARGAAKKKLKGVGKLVIGMTVGRDESKYEGMV